MTEKIIQFIEVLQGITGPASAHRLAGFVHKDVTFSDPFMDAKGKDGLRLAIAAIFEAADPANTQGGRIRVHDYAIGQNGHTAYLRWDRSVNLQAGKRAVYAGMSEIMFGADGLVASITDYFDPALAPRPAAKSLLGRIFQR